MIYTTLGLMSGTSLDGLDMALCEFDTENYADFKIIDAKTEKYPENLSDKIKNSLKLSVVDFVDLHKSYGKFIAEQVDKFLSGRKIDFIASHGHTVIHYPNKNINFQLGDCATISALTGITAICDFRSVDIALGGQGAPLVPIGDKWLFPEYDTFLNIGGFSNISFKRNDSVIAYDICPSNYALNYYAEKLGKAFDFNGNFGKKGEIIPKMLKELQNLEYFSANPPKSLADHWFFDVFLKIVENYDVSIYDKLRTIYELVSIEIAKNIDAQKTRKILITGGGAYNKFLLELIKSRTNAELVVPANEIVDYKEAVIFAFLGVLRIEQQANCLSKVTGAKMDNVGGGIYSAMQVMR